MNQTVFVWHFLYKKNVAQSALHTNKSIQKNTWPEPHTPIDTHTPQSMLREIMS